MRRLVALLAVRIVLSLETYYDLLEVSHNASFAAIRKSFRKKALQYHPDKTGNANDDDASDVFLKLVRAHETLMDPAQRRYYDLGGMQEQSAAGAPSKNYAGFGPLEYDEREFGLHALFPRGAFTFQYRGEGPRRPPPLSATVEITIAEGLADHDTTVTVLRHVTCPHCGGTGGHGDHYHMSECPLCGGAGHALHLFGTIADGGGYAHAVNTTCRLCSGVGKLPTKRCEVCGGARTVTEKAILPIQVPRGSHAGDEIVLHGRGNSHPDRGVGDVLVSIALLPHLELRLAPRNSGGGDNVTIVLDVELQEAVAGTFHAVVPLPEGGALGISAGRLSFSGGRRTLPGRGYAVKGTASARGDLVVLFRVLPPRRLGAAELEALRRALSPAEWAVLQDIQALLALRDAPEADPTAGAAPAVASKMDPAGGGLAGGSVGAESEAPVTEPKEAGAVAVTIVEIAAAAAAAAIEAAVADAAAAVAVATATAAAAAAEESAMWGKQWVEEEVVERQSDTAEAIIDGAPTAICG